MDLMHGTADIEPGLRLRYVTAGAGAGERTVVLLHGFPQTAWSGRHLFAPLVDAGFRVIAPDYRGAGFSSRPHGGYDKVNMARDIRTLVRDHLPVSGPFAMAGHDIGIMVAYAYAYAQAYRDELTHLAVMDSPLPGTNVARFVEAARHQRFDSILRSRPAEGRDARVPAGTQLDVRR